MPKNISNANITAAGAMGSYPVDFVEMIIRCLLYTSDAADE